MILTRFTPEIDYFTNILGVRQVRLDEGFKWGFQQKLEEEVTLKKAFIYLNTLSRYVPENPNSIEECQVEFILLQLGKILR